MARAARATATALTPEAPVTALSGVGDRVQELLARLGLERVSDLWFHLPLRFEDRTQVIPIGAVRGGESVQVEGVIEHVEEIRRSRRSLAAVIADGTGQMLLRFFHYHQGLRQSLVPGLRMRCFGEARAGFSGLEMVHPRCQRLGVADAPLEQSLTPIYPLTEGIGQERMRALVQAALALLPSAGSQELLPKSLRQQHELMPLAEALRAVHRPPAGADTELLLTGAHPAQQRLAFEELLAHQLALRLRRLSGRTVSAPRIAAGGPLAAALTAALPFKLTAAQQRVLEEIAVDLDSGHPMLRLLQGDVGSGKTVVAALAALAAVDAGLQAAVMAPTELLAEQHRRNLDAWLQPLGVELVWLSGRVQGRARQQALERIAAGAPVVVGTHALMQEAVQYRHLGLVVIDEQHRFGVHQRLSLRDKGRDADSLPHTLVMTATPIPRTLAMTAYADLESSVIDQLPPGRQPVRTVVLPRDRRDEVIERLRRALAEGRQAYWVCPLIESSEQLEAEAAEDTFGELRERLSEFAIGLAHGRQPGSERARVMAAFQAGQVALLVATTVIEVGVDVPKASLMVIDNAERMGLAQLHQLRGRVGRGSEASACVLIYQPPLSYLARCRLQVLRESSDGFVIAEKDLELRGPGEFLGTRQAGQAAYRVADLGRDSHWLPELKPAAEWMLAEAPAESRALVRRWVGPALRFAEA